MKEGHIDRVAEWVFPIAALAMIATPAIWTYQIIYWLRFGEWDPIPVSEGLNWIGISEPRFDWAGLQRISDWLITFPLSIAIFLVLLGAIALFSEWFDRREKRAHEAPVTPA